jgi:hypothetical protein
MATLRQAVPVARQRNTPVFRMLSLVVLVASLGLELLPSVFGECIAVAPGECAGRVFCLEPLQGGAEGGSQHVELVDFPVLLPGASGLFPAAQERRRGDDAADPAPDGFHATIDHPPQLPL